MRQIVRIVATAMFCFALPSSWVDAQETPQDEKSSVTLLRTADRIPAEEAYDEELIPLVGRSAFLHDLGEVGALAGKVSAFEFEAVPPGFALAVFTAIKDDAGNIQPTSLPQGDEVTITLRESLPQRDPSSVKAIDDDEIGLWNFPSEKAREAKHIDYPFLLARQGATYSITLDCKAGDKTDPKLHFILIARPVVPGGLASGDNDSVCDGTVDHGVYRRSDFARVPSVTTKTPSGASQLELGPIEVSPSTRHRFEIHNIPNLSHTIGYLASSREELVEAGVEKVHIYLRVKDGPVVINREFDVKDAKLSDATTAPRLIHFAHSDSLDWKIIPNTAVGSTFQPRKGDIYILELTITVGDAEQSKGKNLKVMLRS